MLLHHYKRKISCMFHLNLNLSTYYLRILHQYKLKLVEKLHTLSPAQVGKIHLYIPHHNLLIVRAYKLKHYTPLNQYKLKYYTLLYQYKLGTFTLLHQTKYKLKTTDFPVSVQAENSHFSHSVQVKDLQVHVPNSVQVKNLLVFHFVQVQNYQFLIQYKLMRTYKFLT